MWTEAVKAVQKHLPTRKPAERLAALLTTFGLEELRERFS
jgi:hypothetical protein